MSQLALFRMKRAPPATEFASCCALADLIDLRIKPQWRFTHLPFGEHRDHKINPKTGKRFSLTGQRLTRMGTKKGWPDYVFVGPNRALFWLEMKRGTRGRASSEQEDIAAHLVACGFDYVRAKSVAEAIEALVARGIIHPSKVQ
jgi:hypothetical protein